VGGEDIDQPGPARFDAGVKDAVVALKVYAFASMAYDLGVPVGSADAFKRQRFQVNGIELMPILIAAIKDHCLRSQEWVVMKIETEVIAVLPGQAHHFVVRVL